MKTNIRLFVPNTTEALSFEYGLLIHYTAYNEYRAQSEIGLQYYELAEIDPIDRALDIVQRQIITDAARSQSKIDGFTLDSHYTLSFDQRFNNKVAQDSVRQVWLWLNCKNSTEYHFLLEKITDFEEKRVSDQNQLLVRLWLHPDWTEQDVNPFDQGKIGSRLELISVMKQRLSAQFDQIEQANRQKVLASLKVNSLPIVSTKLENNIIFEEKIKKDICQTKDGKIINDKANENEKKSNQLKVDNRLPLVDKLTCILKYYSGENYHLRGEIPPDLFKNAHESHIVDRGDIVLALIDTTPMGSAKAGMAIGLKGICFRNNWPLETPKTFFSWDELSSINHPIFTYQDFDMKIKELHIFNILCHDKTPTVLPIDLMVDLLNNLSSCYKIHVSGIEENPFFYFNVLSVEKKIDKELIAVSPTKLASLPLRTDINDNIKIEEQKATIGLPFLVIIIGFVLSPVIGWILSAIFWKKLKLIFESPGLFVFWATVFYCVAYFFLINS